MPAVEGLDLLILGWGRWQEEENSTWPGAGDTWREDVITGVGGEGQSF